ncbi:MAG: glycerol-3-phosphate 1-O-acyltransferase PlsY [Candidatus Kapabacteria bacterium]|nr:glycerol-3-phosphate 1-O-acyltransferase PlsY [Candidatus Kapabacteria bacterium]
MQNLFPLIFIVVISYLIGSIPWGVIISKTFFGFDIRTHGSGNMGSTNVLRVLGKKWGFIVQILDMLKGIFAVYFVAVLLGKELIDPNNPLFQNQQLIKIISGISAVLGHIFSIFIGFKGGKGINTAAGMLIGIAPIDFGICAFFFSLAVGTTGYISFGSIVGALTLPFSMLVRYNLFGINIPGYFTLIYFLFGLAILIVYTHRTNITRLIEGKENRFSKLQVIKFGKKV